MPSNQPTNPTDQPLAEQGDGEATQQGQRLTRRRCQQCQALVMPAALNELLRCLSCTGQLDLFPLTDPSAGSSTIKRGPR